MERVSKKFDMIELISFTPAGDREIDLWAIKFTLGIDLKQGNTDQVDFTSSLSAKRRTSKSRFVTDYLGNISKTDAVSGNIEETINNHRLSASIDKYVTRKFFYTPIFAEYYQDAFQNIDKRSTLGIGIGYTFINTSKTEWDISGGPHIYQHNICLFSPVKMLKLIQAHLH